MQETNSSEDMMKMFQQAKNLSDLMTTNVNDNNDNNRRNSNNNSNNFDMEKMMQVFQMMKSFQNTMNSNSNESADPDSVRSAQYSAQEEKEDITNNPFLQENRFKPKYYEQEAETQSIKMMKAALPYMELPQRKNLGIIIKMMEIQKLTEIYSDVSSQEIAYTGDSRRGMLTAIRPYVDVEQRRVIDMFLKCLDLKGIMDNYS